MSAATLEYGKLISRIPPRVIRTEDENQFYLEKVEELTARWDSLSAAERDLYETLTVLIQDFEKKHYKIPGGTPVQVIRTLMEANGLKQKNLVGVVFETASVASYVLRGTRALTKAHIKRLSKRFNVSPAAFFD